LPVGVSFFKGMEKLGGIEVAKNIGGEVTHEPEAPMDILEAAFSIVGGSDAR